MDSTTELKWSAELEVALFHSMHGHKPVGEFICYQQPGALLKDSCTTTHFP